MQKIELTTSLNLLKEKHVCSYGYKKLVSHLGGTSFDRDAPINLLTVLESNNVEDTIWCLCATHQDCDVVARLMAADFAEQSLHIYEREYPDDPRPRNAVEAARAFAHGEISSDDLAASRAAAWAASRDAAWAASRDAAWAASRAASRDAAWAAAWAASRDASRDAAWAAAWDAAWAASRDAAWDASRDAQKEIILRYLTVEKVEIVHDSIVRVPGGSRFTREGRPIKPMGPKRAAEILGKTPDEIRNMADPNKPDHRFYADQIHDLLQEDLDPAYLDELERSIGRVAIRVPDIREHSDLSKELMKAIKEFGDVGRNMSEMLADGRVTRKEFAHFEREVDESMGAIAELREAVRRHVG